MNLYKRYVGITTKLSQLSPWKRLQNHNLLQLFIKDFDYPILANVFTANDETYGFRICLDPIQANFFLTKFDSINESKVSSLRRDQYYFIQYLKYSSLSKNDILLLTEADLDVSEDGLFPVLRKRSWMYGIEEVGDEEIGKICLVLEELYELLSSLLKQNIKKIITDSYPSRYYNPITKSYDNKYLPLDKQFLKIDIAFSLLPEKIETLKKLESNSLVVEFDTMFLPFTINDHPALVHVLVDTATGYILDMGFIEPESMRAFHYLSKFVEYVLKYGYFQEVRCRDRIDQKILRDIDEFENMKIVVKKLEIIDKVIEEFVEKNL